MAKRGNIFYTDKDFTDLEIQQEFGFPVIVILHDNNSVIKKISAFDENGNKTIYDFKFLDKQGGFISFKMDYYGVFEKVVNEWIKMVEIANNRAKKAVNERK